MLALAKDITNNKHVHSIESEHPKLKEYMDYQRKLNHDLIIYHSLDQAKTFLRQNMDECGEDREKPKAFLKKTFPFSHEFAGADNLLLMLRKLINAQNSTNNWYRLNQFYYAVLYDSVERFVKIYNKLIEESPEKAREYNLSDGVAVDFDDWAQLYFENFDFMIGKKPGYAHFIFRKRNKKIEEAIAANVKGGKSREAALEAVKDDFGIDPSAVKIILGKTADHKDLELFYTSAENPIYEYLYDSEATAAFADGESLIDHSYFIGHILKGLSEKEAESVIGEMEKAAKE